MKDTVSKILAPHKKKKIVISVSGGIDSLVLLDILMELNYSLVVVNFNHQQRKESVTEANYIKDLCKNNNISFEYFILNIDENENFQSVASDLRRKHLIDVAKKYHTDVIVTAHHLNDLAETIILKLSRGSNLLGYAGMQQSYYKYYMYFIKPLLYVAKEEIINYAKKHNIKYFFDQSNLSEDYTRNKIRHNVIPYLIKDNSAFLTKVIEYNKNLSDAFNFIRNETIKFLNGSLSFNIDEFLKLDEALKVDVIAYMLEEHNLNISTEKIMMITDFLASSGPNATLDLGDNLEFIKVYDSAHIALKSKILPFKQQLYFDKENILPNGKVIILNNKIEENISNPLYLCYNNKVQPLYARTRKDGDKLYFPYGHKKLKDFYIDKKVPLNERDNDILIVDNDDNILAVLGKYTNNHPDLTDKLILIYRRKWHEFRQSNWKSFSFSRWN